MEVPVLAPRQILLVLLITVIGNGAMLIRVVVHYQIEHKPFFSSSRFDTATKLAYSYAACASCDKRVTETDCGRNGKCAWNSLSNFCMTIIDNSVAA